MAQVLRPLKGMFAPTEYPNLIVGLNQPDDAGVYQLDSERAIISTTDFFPPVVDDPYTFGAIAAANALSDVYAMGGTPIMAINLVAFPDGHDMSILTDILRGGAETAKLAGIAIAGGHTVADKEPKYGLAVTGEVHPQKMITKGGARPGDVLLLTKPLGTGVITTALKNQRVDDQHLQAAVDGMSHLNRVSAEMAMRYNDAHGTPVVHAMTDITGFGLIGHAHELAHLSQASLHINFDQLQWYDGTFTYAEADIFPGGMHRNRNFFQKWVTFVNPRPDWQEYLLYDPQTSGGLLMAVDPDHAEALYKDLQAAGEAVYILGHVRAGNGDIEIS